MPRLSEGANEAEIVEWMIDVGDPVNAGDTIVVVALDKVDADVTSPVAGRLVEVLAKEGDTVAVGHPICVVEE